MFQKAFSFAGTLLLAGAAVLIMPGFGQAQHGGGGHGGGGHFGGGGAHFAGGSGHFSGAHYGGYRGGLYGGGARYGGPHYGYGRSRSYYGGYSYYPYYGRYGSNYPYYSDTYPYLSSSPMYDSGYSGSYGEVPPDFGYGTNSTPSAAGDYQVIYPSSTATAEPDTAVHLTVKAPADAQLWFNGTPTAATGTVRQFDSPPLAAGKYIYDVQARWTENGHEVTETRQIEVTPGSRVEVDFPTQPRTLKNE
jgi:uncharacterized protein (TIGR03000 family)